MAGTRQLAAIISTEIDGYGALIQQNESKASELKERYREVLYRVANTFQGKIVKNIGPDSLSLYTSAVEAVQCAIELQKAFREEPVVPVKIGIHLGDITLIDDEVIGESIEVVRQMKSRSLAGGILVSNKIFEEVKNQSGIGISYLKACDLKEQGIQVHVYAITNEGLAIPVLPRSTTESEPREGRRFSVLHHIWEEAKRRNVVRVIAVYAGAAFVIIELINNIEDPLGLPNWLPTVVVLLVILGFPVTAVFFWIFDITPEGLVKTKPAREVEIVEKESQPASDLNWFTRNKVFKRYLVPFFIFALLVCFYFFKGRLFENWHRVNRVARDHTDTAVLYYNFRADPAMIKQELDLALEADSEYAKALYYYALVYRMEMDTVHAKQKLHAAVASDPGYSLAWDLLASFAYMQDSSDLAMRYALKASESDPGNTIATYNLAIQFEYRGFNDQAVELYRRVNDMDSTFTAAYSALGALYNKLNRPGDAIITLHRSLDIDPFSVDNYRIYKNLAQAYFLLADYDTALEYLEQSKALKPDYEETERCFAKNYEALGDMEASILHWRRYLALETDTLKLLKAQQHLDSLRSQVPK